MAGVFNLVAQSSVMYARMRVYVSVPNRCFLRDTLNQRSNHECGELLEVHPSPPCNVSRPDGKSENFANEMLRIDLHAWSTTAHRLCFTLDI